MSTGPAAQEANGAGTAGVIARPPLLFLAALLLGFVLDHLLPLPRPIPSVGLVHWISAVIAGCLILIGIALFSAGVRNFSRAATPVQGTKPTRALVTTGIHGWSRNPIYLGMFLVYGGIGIAVRSPWVVILALPLAVTIRYGVVAREESYLERRCGRFRASPRSGALARPRCRSFSPRPSSARVSWRAGN
jgi:protein-S-isoprenylcysteine O-methyltransferase Ste14